MGLEGAIKGRTEACYSRSKGMKSRTKDGGCELTNRKRLREVIYRMMYTIVEGGCLLDNRTNSSRERPGRIFLGRIRKTE